jgi:hypothetical protein
VPKLKQTVRKRAAGGTSPFRSVARYLGPMHVRTLRLGFRVAAPMLVVVGPVLAASTFPTPKGAGRTSPPVEVDRILHPASTTDFRTTLQALYRTPAWFPLPESIVRNNRDSEMNTIQALSVSQELPRTRADSPLRTEVVLTYLQPKMSPKQALDWLRSRPGYPKFKILDGTVTGNFATPYQFSSGNQTMSVYSRPSEAPVKGSRLTVSFTDVTTKFTRFQGLIPVSDWPQGVAWESVETFASQSYGTEKGSTAKFHGSHSVSFVTDATGKDSAQLKRTLSDPSSYTGNVRLAGKPTTRPNGTSGDKSWSIPIVWFSRPGTCTVNDFVESNRSSARCKVNFAFE